MIDKTVTHRLCSPPRKGRLVHSAGPLWLCRQGVHRKQVMCISSLLMLEKQHGCVYQFRPPARTGCGGPASTQKSLAGESFSQLNSENELRVSYLWASWNPSAGQGLSVDAASVFRQSYNVREGLWLKLRFGEGALRPRLKKLSVTS